MEMPEQVAGEVLVEEAMEMPLKVVREVPTLCTGSAGTRRCPPPPMRSITKGYCR